MKSIRRGLFAAVWLWTAGAVAQTSGSALESATGPSVGISAGGYTGSALGSSHYFQSTPPTTSPEPTSSSAVPSFGTTTGGATSTSAATGRATTTAPAGVSAV